MAATKLIHILGGGQWQLPTIRLARSLGYRILVTDIYEERPGYALADEHAVVDITDRESTLKVAQRHQIDAIVCDTTDVGVPTMAYVAEKMGLPGIGYETALNFTNKYRMRCITAQAGVPNPCFRLARSIQDARQAAGDIGFPAVIKPVDNQSSRGVHVVYSPNEIEGAYTDAARYTRADAVMVEGFLDGVEVTVESLAIDGEVMVLGISDKDHFVHRPEVASRLTYPADFPAAILERIREVNQLTIKALGMQTGITHAEYMVTDSEVYLVEIAARGAGSRIHSDIVPYLAGAPVPKAYLQFLAGETISVRPDGEPRAANLAFFSFPSGTVKRLCGVEEARLFPGVHEILLEFGVGDQLTAPQDDRSRPGLVIALGKSRAEVLDITDRVFRTVQVQTE
jgi:carbamoyl-phosphate synthase large subunit